MGGFASTIVLCAYFLVAVLFGGPCGVESALSAAANCRECSGSKMLRSAAPSFSADGGVVTGDNNSEIEMMHEARLEYYRALILHKLNVTEMTGDSNGGHRVAAASGSVATSARKQPHTAPSLLRPLLAPLLSDVAAQNLQWLPEPLLVDQSFLPQDRPGDIKMNNFYAETKQYFLLAGDASAECRSSSARRRTCMRFNVRSVNARDAIVSAKLYVWTPEIDRLLSRGGEGGGRAATAGGVVQVRQLSAQWRPGPIVTESLLPKAASFGRGAVSDGDDGDGIAMRSNQSNWLQFDLRKDAVRSWLGGDPNISIDGVVRLELACKDCVALTVDMSKRKPFLLIDIEQPEAVERLQWRQRSKRQAASGGGSTKLYCDQVPAGQQTCCIERLQVLFSEFYPHIVHPKGFYPNYCRGSCSAFGQQISYANTNIVRAKLDTKKIRYVPCCVPTRMASIDVLYFDDDDSTIQMKSLPNMVVEECGCM